YALEAARAVIAYAHRTLGIEQLYAIVRGGNQRSVSLLERLGFRRAAGAVPPDLDAELFQLNA
ncbi:MAG TPA: GNAT family N-acetyltransferase, partial [Gemmatimonadales bacterium]|nr:GNAT family N-acetyltransferase [Gemmatimonadales bacterium]